MIDLRNVNLNLLVSLDALLNECNVTRAAQQLHLSQSTVSAQLAQLRHIFGDALLVPAENGRGMTRTARADALAEPLRAALKDLEKLVKHRPDFDPTRDQRDFHIAASDNATLTFGLPLMKNLHRIAGPGIRLAFRNADPIRIAEQMERGDIDLLMGSERMVPSTMKARLLIKEEFVMAQRKGHPRGTGILGMDEYCALQHVLVSTTGGSLFGFMDEQLAAHQRERNVVISVQQFTLVPEILRTTDYVCTLPRKLVNNFAHILDYSELPFEAAGFSLYAAWHPRTQNDPAAVWLREYVISHIQQG